MRLLEEIWTGRIKYIRSEAKLTKLFKSQCMTSLKSHPAEEDNHQKKVTSKKEDNLCMQVNMDRPDKHFLMKA